MAWMQKISTGCMNCYVYRRDAEFGKDSSIVTRTASFDLPVKRDRKREYKLQPERECVYTCMTSDFSWRKQMHGVLKRGR